MNIFENESRNFIQKMKTSRIIEWDDQKDYPEFSSKKFKSTENWIDSEEDRVEKLISNYLDDSELHEQLSKDEIYLITDFLYSLIRNVCFQDK